MKRYLALLALSILSGYFVLLSESWSSIYKANLLFHPAVSLTATVFFYFLVARKHIPLRGQGFFKSATIAGVVLTIILGFLRTGYPSDIWGVILLAAYPLYKIRDLRDQPDKFFTACSSYFFASLVTSGAIFTIQQGGREFEHLLILHRQASHSFVLTFIMARLLTILRTGTLGAKVTHEAPKIHRFKKIRLAVMAVVGLIVIWMIRNEIRQGENDPYYEFHFSTFSVERRGPTEQDTLPTDFTEPDLGTKSASCADSAGCHPRIFEDMSVSVHARSMHVKYFHKNMELLAEEIGKQNQITCGGCHYGRMMFDRTRQLSDSYTELNYSCTFCHLIDSVSLWKDRRKSNLGISLPLNHLRMFDENGNDAISSFDKLLINLNPFGHARVFKKDLYSEDRYCQVCHRLQIRATDETPMNKPRCIDCHMQPRELLGLEGKVMNHIFPGTNTFNPLLLGNEKVLEINQKYSSGDLPLPIKGWGSFWEPRDDMGERKIWILQKAMPLADPVPGEKFGIRIITINAGIDHIFPGGALDLIEAWQKIIITDQNGKVLLHIGELDENYRIDPLAHRMGGHMTGEDGHIVDRNRVWQIKEKVIERAIPFHHSTYDDYVFELPENATEIHIESYWMFRKMNQDFVDWVYGPNEKTVPPVQASDMRATMQVAN
jgi:hypothetical protein